MKNFLPVREQFNFFFMRHIVSFHNFYQYQQQQQQQQQQQ